MIFSIFLYRIVVNFILASIIGLERQLHKRMIGFRTNILVSIGVFLFVSSALSFKPNETVRMAAQVISGIGFLGAGAIVRDNGTVRGINTAATLWCSAAIAIACSIGLIKEAIIGTFLILFVNIFLRFIIEKITLQKKIKEAYFLNIVCNNQETIKIINNLKRAETLYDYEIISLKIIKNDTSILQIKIKTNNIINIENVISFIKSNNISNINYEYNKEIREIEKDEE